MMKRYSAFNKRLLTHQYMVPSVISASCASHGLVHRRSRIHQLLWVTLSPSRR